MDKNMINLLLDRHDIEAYKKHLLPDQNLLMLKLQGDHDEAHKAISLITEITQRLGGVNMRSATATTEMENIWNIRKRALFIVQ